VRLNEGSPVWLATVITPTNPLNTLSFDLVFLGTNGSDSLLSVHWNEAVIGTVTESRVRPGYQHYSLSFPQVKAAETHMLGFRLDPFTNALSSAILTNVNVTQMGLSEPFTLSIISNSSSGLIYELKGEPGFNFSIQSSSNLIDWSTIAQLINTNGAVRFVDPNATNYTRLFYRALGPGGSTSQ
jgi:hypothetical protein